MSHEMSLRSVFNHDSFFANQHFPHFYTLFKYKDFVAPQSQLGYRLPNQNSFQIVLFIKKQD